MYTAIFTPYVAAFLLSEPDYNSRKAKKYSDDPIVIIDLIGKFFLTTFAEKIYNLVRFGQIYPYKSSQIINLALIYLVTSD